MILTISTTHRPATDLGYLLHKHPDRTQSFELPFGRAHFFYTVADEDRCTAALLLDIDPLRLVRGAGAMLRDYVNDRAYASSSFMCVAMARTLASAMSGRCERRRELAATPIPLEAGVAAVPCRLGDALLRSLFEPLGYEVDADDGGNHAGDGRYWNLRLKAVTTVSALLSHLYVLLPVADNRKHYFIGAAEIEKLMKRGEGWLEQHPERDLIVKRYLGHRKALAAEAAALLDKGLEEPEENGSPKPEPPTEAPRLHDLRHRWAADVLSRAKALRIVDLGCGEGKFLRILADRPEFDALAGADASAWSLQIARRRIRKRPRGDADGRVKFFQTALTFRDERLDGFDAATLIEVIEHIDPQRLPMLEHVLFGCMKPRTIVLTTPNRDYNPIYEIENGAFRHRDHRFEWTRAEFRAWAERITTEHGYDVSIGGVGDEDETLGTPTQTGVFTRCG